MTKKHFIELADTMRDLRSVTKDGLIEIDKVEYELARFCASQNYRFNRERWLSYIAGECGPNGGAVKQPKDTTRELEVTP